MKQMNKLAEYLNSLKRRSKSDIIPGTGELSGKRCPLCQREMYKMFKCCGQPHDMLVCNHCDYKEVVS